MQNPNMKVSDVKIVLKNISKNLDKSFWMKFAKELLKEDYEGNINTAKLFEKIQVLKEQNKDKNKGIIFLEFTNAELALKFINRIKEPQNYKQI